MRILTFLTKYHLKFSEQSSLFPNEKTKIYYADSHLAKSMFSWFQPLLAAAEDSEKNDANRVYLIPNLAN